MIDHAQFYATVRFQARSAPEELGHLVIYAP